MNSRVPSGACACPGCRPASSSPTARWTGAAGWADIVARRPMTTATVFDIGSITKTFVAAEMMRLVEGGMLRLDEPLAAGCPAYPRRPAHAARAAGPHQRPGRLLLRTRSSCASSTPRRARPGSGGVAAVHRQAPLPARHRMALLQHQLPAPGDGHPGGHRRTWGTSCRRGSWGRSVCADSPPAGRRAGHPASSAGPLARALRAPRRAQVAGLHLDLATGRVTCRSPRWPLARCGRFAGSARRATCARWGADLYGGRVLRGVAAGHGGRQHRRPFRARRFTYGLGTQRGSRTASPELRPRRRVLGLPRGAALLPATSGASIAVLTEHRRRRSGRHRGPAGGPHRGEPLAAGAG